MKINSQRKRYLSIFLGGMMGVFLIMPFPSQSLGGPKVTIGYPEEVRQTKDGTWVPVKRAAPAQQGDCQTALGIIAAIRALVAEGTTVERRSECGGMEGCANCIITKDGQEICDIGTIPIGGGSQAN